MGLTYKEKRLWCLCAAKFMQLEEIKKHKNKIRVKTILFEKKGADRDLAQRSTSH